MRNTNIKYKNNFKSPVECHSERSEESTPNITSGFFTSFRMTFFHFFELSKKLFSMEVVQFELNTKFNLYIIRNILFLCMLILFSCGDCNLITADYPCQIREATITLFDPRVNIINDSVIVPVPTYSNHTFQFPNDNASSGLLTNDNRFDVKDVKKQFIVLDNIEYTPSGSNETHTVQLVSINPSNTNMIGDLMVVDVNMNSTPNSALLRFYGYLARFPNDFFSEDAYKFCQQYLEGYRKSDINYGKIRQQSTSNGSGLPNSVQKLYNINNIRVLDSKGNDVSDIYKSSIPSNILSGIYSSNKSTAIDIQVKAGQVYYYKARNGKEFAVVIVDIRQGTFEPFMKRVTIKFSELVGTKTTECPTQ
ncbi:MAG: hypothetical protein HW421_188 [Ignavibacteria bacterium]|nr:hypothetical protein [Ignavibacteria bacterium]